jgi:hypothetical protein
MFSIFFTNKSNFSKIVEKKLGVASSNNGEPSKDKSSAEVFLISGERD